MIRPFLEGAGAIGGAAANGERPHTTTGPPALGGDEAKDQLTAAPREAVTAGAGAPTAAVPAAKSTA